MSDRCQQWDQDLYEALFGCMVATDDPEEAILVALTKKEMCLVIAGGMKLEETYPVLEERINVFRGKLNDLIAHQVYDA